MGSVDKLGYAGLGGRLRTSVESRWRAIYPHKLAWFSCGHLGLAVVPEHAARSHSETELVGGPPVSKSKTCGGAKACEATRHLPTISRLHPQEILGQSLRDPNVDCGQSGKTSQQNRYLCSSMIGFLG